MILLLQPAATSVLNLHIYPRFFDADLVKERAGLLTHELGHTLGLRHEFLEPDENTKCLWGPLFPIQS
jgi:predicted Zn-dependent protease